MTERERVVAYHEAGHAVVARALGFCVRRVSVRGNLRKKRNGYVSFGDLVYDDTARIPVLENGKWLKPRERWQRSRDLICVLTSGKAATAIGGVDSLSEDDYSGACGDYVEVWNVLQDWGWAFSTMRRVVREENRRACAILGERWLEVDILVKALEYHRSLGEKTLGKLWKIASQPATE